jgi:GMP reductase
MKISNDIKLDFDDVLIVPQPNNINSRSEVDLSRTFYFPRVNKSLPCIPIIAANMTTVSSFKMAKELGRHRLMTALHKYYNEDELTAFFETNLAKNLCWYTVGSNKEDLDKFKRVNYNKTIDKVCIDVANGYRNTFLDTVSRLRDENPEAIIMAGNVVTPDQTESLIKAGADVVKIGIGGGAGCLTRLKTGVGYPMISAISECSEVAYDLNAFICADGGCKNPGDIAKAFGAGADFVMLGSMLAGHDEVEAKKITDSTGNSFVEFYGMSSEKAMQEFNNGMAKYRTTEGRHVMLPAKGPVEKTVLDILGGLRSTLTYVGSENLKELSDMAIFVRVNHTHNTIYEKLGNKID